jgi:hypothetical protein
VLPQVQLGQAEKIMNKNSYSAIRRGMRSLSEVAPRKVHRKGNFIYSFKSKQLHYLDEDGIPTLIEWTFLKKNPDMTTLLETDLLEIARFPADQISDEAKLFQDRITELQEKFDSLQHELNNIGHRIHTSQKNKFSITRIDSPKSADSTGQEVVDNGDMDVGVSGYGQSGDEDEED